MCMALHRSLEDKDQRELYVEGGRDRMAAYATALVDCLSVVRA